MARRSLIVAGFVAAWAAACGGESVRRGAAEGDDDRQTGGSAAEPGSGGMSSSSSASAGGSGSIQVIPSKDLTRCEEILEEHRVATEAAQHCFPGGPACDEFVRSDLVCGCYIAVTDASETLGMVGEWFALGCSSRLIECPRPCPNQLNVFACSSEGRCYTHHGE